MKTLRYVFPGRFCPPTFGHFNIVKRAAEMLPHVAVVCSTNPDKTNDIFEPSELKELWDAYNLPANVSVVTFEEFKSAPAEGGETVIIRGIRNYDDLRAEERVMALNKEMFGIDKYFYLVGDDGLKQISASKTRALAADLQFEELAWYIAPLIISKLIERLFGFKNLFMVVGRPGSGKSTFLKMLAEANDENIHINTDEFNKKVRPLLLEVFGDQDLIRLSIEQKEEFTAVIKKAWFDLLREAIRGVRTGANVFLEIPYGLQADKAIYNFVGGKIIYVGCEGKVENERRLKERGTSCQAVFIEEIPDRKLSEEIARLMRLDMISISTYCSLFDLKAVASSLNSRICKGG